MSSWSATHDITRRANTWLGVDISESEAYMDRASMVDGLRAGLTHLCRVASGANAFQELSGKEACNQAANLISKKSFVVLKKMRDLLDVFAAEAEHPGPEKQELRSASAPGRKRRMRG